MNGSLDMAVSGMIAQRTRMEVAIANMVNQNTIDDGEGNNVPFQRRFAVLTAGDPNARGAGAELGVHVSSIELDDSPPMPRHEPDSPYADEEGYVLYPNIDPMTEMINGMDAQRAYEANLAAAEAAKAMVAQALRLLV
jgi:flagellar basal-body rod protein FlgC